MKKGNLLYLLLIFVFSASAFAQQTYTPAKNSPERAAIFNALRVPVSKELKQNVSFAANNFKAQGNWAFIGGQVRNSKGDGSPNWKITKYQEQIDADSFEDNLFALLKKTGGKWRVVTYMIGCNDVCYLDWDKQYKAPSAIFK